MGDYRVTRWLTIITDEDDLEDAVIWQRLVKFLEKELKVQQQKVLINIRPPEPKKVFSSKPNTTHTVHIASYEDQNECFICSERGHVTTSGPQGSKLIQYFACKKFAEMTPNERFLTLKNNNLCFLCLFPGAQQASTKHKEGNCQRDFTCKHPSHDRYPMKKHVLVCQEHADNEENK